MQDHRAAGAAGGSAALLTRPSRGLGGRTAGSSDCSRNSRLACSSCCRPKSAARHTAAHVSLLALPPHGRCQVQALQENRETMRHWRKLTASSWTLLIAGVAEAEDTVRHLQKLTAVHGADEAAPGGASLGGLRARLLRVQRGLREGQHAPLARKVLHQARPGQAELHLRSSSSSSASDNCIVWCDEEQLGAARYGSMAARCMCLSPPPCTAGDLMGHIGNAMHA